MEVIYGAMERGTESKLTGRQLYSSKLSFQDAMPSVCLTMPILSANMLIMLDGSEKPIWLMVDSMQRRYVQLT